GRRRNSLQVVEPAHLLERGIRQKIGCYVLADRGVVMRPDLPYKRDHRLARLVIVVNTHDATANRIGSIVDEKIYMIMITGRCRPVYPSRPLSGAANARPTRAACRCRPWHRRSARHPWSGKTAPHARLSRDAAPLGAAARSHRPRGRPRWPEAALAPPAAARR